MPAVVGVGEDLASLKNGDLVEVDGDEGTIRLKKEDDKNDL
jgi:phosphoenolpyruvate-protein kinase (PTS system EI component)